MTSTRGHDSVSKCVKELLISLGLSLDNHHLQDTPDRVAKFLLEATSNGAEGALVPEDILKPLWEEEYDYPITVTGIKFSSLCAHHMLPFFGYITVGYYPRNVVTGLSKLPRLVNLESKGLQLQEELTKNIVKKLQENLDPKGVAVHIKAEHTCMTIRGVQAQESATVTSYFIGLMNKEPFRSDFIRTAEGGGARWG